MSTHMYIQLYIWYVYIYTYTPYVLYVYCFIVYCASMSTHGVVTYFTDLHSMEDCIDLPATGPAAPWKNRSRAMYGEGHASYGPAPNANSGHGSPNTHTKNIKKRTDFFHRFNQKTSTLPLRLASRHHVVEQWHHVLDDNTTTWPNVHLERYDMSYD